MGTVCLEHGMPPLVCIARPSKNNLTIAQAPNPSCYTSLGWAGRKRSVYTVVTRATRRCIQMTLRSQSATARLETSSPKVETPCSGFCIIVYKMCQPL